MAAVLALTLVRLVCAAAVGLTGDEAYYRLWSLHPALGYYDHAPMVAWWIALGRHLGGDTALGVRLFTVLATALGSWAVYETARELFDRPRVAARAVLWFNATLLIGVGGIIATPDAPSVLFWALALWAMARLIRTGHGGWWLAVGGFAGLGLLSKYSVLFLGPGLALWALALPAGRRWLLRPAPWIGALLAGILFLPVVYWNADHHWVSFAKQFGRVAPAHGYSLHYLEEFLASLTGLLNPFVAGFAGLGLWAWARNADRRRDPARLLLAATTLPFFCYLLFHALHARVQGNWAAPLYPGLAILAAEAAEGVRGPIGTRLRGWALPFGLGLSALILVHGVFPLTAAFGKRDPTQQTRDWPALAGHLDALRRAQGAEWVATVSYTTQGQLAFHLPPAVPVVQVDERVRYAFAPPPDPALLKRPALLVVLERRDAPALFVRCFGSARLVGEVKRTLRGTVLAKYRVYRVADPVPDLFTRGCEPG